MRVPYAPSTAPEDPTTKAIYERVEARRSPRPLQPLDLALLHSPHVADGWNSFLGAVRTKTSLPANIREIAICRVAICNGANYEWDHHAPLALQGGVSEEGMKTLGEKEPAEGAPGLTEQEWAVLRLADEMTRKVTVPDEVFDKAKSLFSAKEVIEIVSTVSLSSGT
jgi:alkylhydroperoxidase family enzyme